MAESPQDPSSNPNPDAANEPNASATADQGPQADAAAASQPAGEPTKDERMMAMLAHLLGIVLGVIGPLIIWLIKREESTFINDQGKEALNFQITVLIASVVIGVITAITCGAGAVLIPVLIVAVLVFCIMAGLKANEGQLYRYPVTLRLIK